MVPLLHGLGILKYMVCSQAANLYVKAGVNYDVCASCGLDGVLVCCDDCPKAYHPNECLDPSVDPDTIPSWHCNECLEARNPTAKRDLGVVTELDSEINKVNTKMFLLSQELREYFEGVRTVHERLCEWDYADDTLIPKTK